LTDEEIVEIRAQKETDKANAEKLERIKAATNAAYEEQYGAPHPSTLKPTLGETIQQRAQFDVPAAGAVGLATGAPVVGPLVGMVAGATESGVGGATEWYLRKQGMSETKARLIGDATSAVFGGFGAAAARRTLTGVRGAKHFKKVDPTGAVAGGTARGTEEVTDVARRGYQRQEARTQRAFDEWNAGLAPDAGLDPSGLRSSLDDIAKEARFEEGSGSFQVSRTLKDMKKGERLNASDLQNARSAVLNDARAANLAGDHARARRAYEVAAAIEEQELRLAANAKDGGESLRRLRVARKERRALADLEGGRGGKDTVMYSHIIDPNTRLDSAPKAVRKIINSPRPGESVRQLRRAAEIGGGAGEVTRLNRALKRGALEDLFGISEGARATNSQMLKRLAEGEGLYRDLLGSGGYDNLVTLLKKPAGKGAKVGLPDMVGGLAGVGMYAQTESTTALLVAGGFTVLRGIYHQYGPAAAREMAYAALTNPRLARRLTTELDDMNTAIAVAGGTVAAAVNHGWIGDELLDGIGEE
jgi:hypothetical protein